MIIIVENYFQYTETSAQEDHNIMILETIEFTKRFKEETDQYFPLAFKISKDLSKVSYDTSCICHGVFFCFT